MPSIPEEPEVLESEVERRTMPDFITPLRDVEVVEGKEAVLKCKVSGLPYPTITWYHNGKKIDSTDDRKMTQCKCTCGDPSWDSIIIIIVIIIGLFREMRQSSLVFRRHLNAKRHGLAAWV